MKFIDVFKKSSEGAQDGEFSKIFGEKALLLQSNSGTCFSHASRNYGALCFMGYDSTLLQ